MVDAVHTVLGNDDDDDHEEEEDEEEEVSEGVKEEKKNEFLKFCTAYASHTTVQY